MILFLYGLYLQQATDINGFSEEMFPQFVGWWVTKSGEAVSLMHWLPSFNHRKVPGIHFFWWPN
jgi:hypothetical protein